jgi:hypothetical protein
MEMLLVSVVGATLVFFGARFLKVRLTPLAYLGAGVLAAAIGIIVARIAKFSDPVVVDLDGNRIPIVTLLIGAAIVTLLLKVVRALR